MTDNLTPKAIVAALDEHIVGQKDAKRAVAVALRNRWRRQRLTPELRDEVTPKNILMIGPTGCGKTEISRRLAKLAEAPFVKVEATKFTEVGYVGRDVEQIARDLVEEAIRLEKERRRDAVRAAASDAAMQRLLNALVGENASEATREAFRERIVENAMNDTEVEIDVEEAPQMPFDMGGMGGNVGMIDLSDMMGKALGRKPTKRRKLRVPDAWDKLVEEEAEKRMDQDDVHGRDRQDRCQRCARRIGQPRGCSARSPAADRRHHGGHQIRPDEDRPCAVHRQRCLSHGQAVRHAARIAEIG